jgi:hypothetical protein
VCAPGESWPVTLLVTWQRQLLHHSFTNKPVKKVRACAREWLCVRGLMRAGRAGHPYQTTDSVEGTRMQADREVRAGNQDSREAGESIKKPSGAWKKATRTGDRTRWDACVFQRESVLGRGVPWFGASWVYGSGKGSREAGESKKNQAGLEKRPQERGTGLNGMRVPCNSRVCWVGVSHGFERMGYTPGSGAGPTGQRLKIVQGRVQGCEGGRRLFPWGAVGLVDLQDDISAGVVVTFQYLIGSPHRTFHLSDNRLRGIAIDPDVD